MQKWSVFLIFEARIIYEKYKYHVFQLYFLLFS
jgi:hypothetical protein